MGGRHPALAPGSGWGPKYRLILLGISTFWQGTFVGSFIIVAVLFDCLRTQASGD